MGVDMGMGMCTGMGVDMGMGMCTGMGVDSTIMCIYH